MLNTRKLHDWQKEVTVWGIYAEDNLLQLQMYHHFVAVKTKNEKTIGVIPIVW